MGWLTCVCGSGFNFFSHGSQDLYPTYLQTTKGFDSYHSTVATIIGNCGAIAYVSELTPFMPFAYRNVCLLSILVSTVVAQSRVLCHNSSVVVSPSLSLFLSLAHSSRCGFYPTHLVDFRLAHSGYNLACRVRGVSSRSNSPR